jgi:CAAX protease family protein
MSAGNQVEAAPRDGLPHILRWLFFSPRERRLRAGWRLLAQTVLLVLFLVVASLGALLLPRGLAARILSPNSLLGVALSEVAELAAVMLSVWLVRRFLDHRPFVALGIAVNRRTLADLGIGFAISMVMMASIFIAEVGLGWLAITGTAWQASTLQTAALQVLAFLGVFVLVGWNEELLSRGYQLQTISSGLGLPAGLIVSSAIFGVLHLANPHASLMAAGGILVAGLFLGYAYVRTGQLWLSIGLHIGWNFFEGVVFGFPVSGFNMYRLVTTRIAGPELWTGGQFGPEAGLILLPATLIGFVLVRLLGKRTSAGEGPDQGRPI